MPEIQTAVSRFRFDSRAAPERDRLAVWREVFGRKVARLDIAPIRDGQRSFAEVSALALPGVSISYCEYEDVRSARTHELTGDGGDDILFGFVESGRVVVNQRGRELTVDPGGATLLATALPNWAAAPVRTRLFNLMAPRAAFQDRVSDLNGRLARPSGRDVIALRLLRGYVREIWDSRDEDFTPEFAVTASAHIQDLLAISIGAAFDPRERSESIRAARRVEIRRLLAARHREPALRVEDIAHDLALSSSYVRRLLDEGGASFSDSLLDIRLETAHRLLTSKQGEGLTVLEIAEASGFADLSWFNRAFRRRYHATPSELRQSVELS